jgi:HEAT repeat protein
MRRYYFLSVLIASAIMNAAGAENQPTNGPSPAARGDTEANNLKLTKTKEARTSIRNILSKRSRPPNTPPERVSDDQINVLIQGLNDSSDAVRNEALQGLSLVAAANRPAGHLPRPGIPDLAQFPEAKEALLKTANDTNPDIRASAIGIYAFTFPLTPELEARWFAVFNEDPSVPRKEGILKALLSSPSPSKNVIALALEQLKDSRFAYSAAVTLLGRVKPPPPEALPTMVTAFSRSSDPGKRDLLARAIVSFGTQAKQFLPVLREMRNDEKDPTVKANLGRAISELEKR